MPAETGLLSGPPPGFEQFHPPAQYPDENARNRERFLELQRKKIEIDRELTSGKCGPEKVFRLLSDANEVDEQIQQLASLVI